MAEDFTRTDVDFVSSGTRCAAWLYRGYLIARPLDNPYLDRYVSRFRAAYGQIVLPKHGSAAQVEAVLSGGGRISLLGDQHAGPKGCWVDFLGRPASCHTAVALLTLTGGAPLLVTYLKRVGGPLQFEAGLMAVADPQTPGQEQADVKSLTRWYNAMLEQVILGAPEQYWWVHRRWKGEPPRKRAEAKTAQSRGADTIPIRAASEFRPYLSHRKAA